MTGESSTDRILEIIDAGLAEVPAPVYGRTGKCDRCGSAADEEVCGECRAFLLGDSEKDPAGLAAAIARALTSAGQQRDIWPSGMPENEIRRRCELCRCSDCERWLVNHEHPPTGITVSPIDAEQARIAAIDEQAAIAFDGIDLTPYVTAATVSPGFSDGIAERIADLADATFTFSGEIEMTAEPGTAWDTLVAYVNDVHAQIIEREAERQRQADWDRTTDAAGLPRVMRPWRWEHHEHRAVWVLIHDPGDWRRQRTVLTLSDEILADGDPEMLRGWLRRQGVPLYDDAGVGDLARLIRRLPAGAPLYVTPDEHAELVRHIPRATASEWDLANGRPHPAWTGISVIIDAEAAVRQRRQLLG